MSHELKYTPKRGNLMIPPISRINAIPKHLPKKVNSDKKEKMLKSLYDEKNTRALLNIDGGRSTFDIKA